MMYTGWYTFQLADVNCREQVETVKLVAPGLESTLTTWGARGRTRGGGHWVMTYRGLGVLDDAKHPQRDTHTRASEKAGGSQTTWTLEQH